LPTRSDLQTRGSLPQVIIDLEKLRHINTGLGRFSLHLGHELLRVARGRFQPVFFLPRGGERHFPTGGFERIEAAEWKKEGMQRFVRPFVQPLLPSPAVALWHVSHQTSKYMPLDARIPVVLTIHDLNFMHEGPTENRRREIERKLAAVQRRIDRATAIVTVSQFTADDVMRHLALDGKPIHVVPNGMAPPPTASAVPPAFMADGRFLLCVGNVLPHKNFHVLIGLVEQLPGRRLVIAGKKETPYGMDMQREIERRGLGDRVLMPGEVSDGDRQWLYEHCDAFLFPSLAEGFGFPVLEAMQCGKPVFISRATSLPEIGGEHGFYFDSYDPGSMADVFHAGMARVDKMPGFADTLRSRAASFAWASAAERYAQIYETVLANCS